MIFYLLPGTTVQLFAMGCSNTYEWSHGVTSINNDGTSSIITVTPNETTTYKVRCKIDDGCKSSWTAEFKIRVNNSNPCNKPLAAPIVSSDKVVLKSDDDIATLTAFNCSGTITWNNGSVGSKITVSVAEKYTATCTIDDCISEKSNEITIIREGCITPRAPVISAEKTILKENESTKLTAMGCDGIVSWSNGNKGFQIVVATRGKYTAKCTAGGCISNISNEIEITSENCTPPSSPTISISKSIITQGEKVTINGTCASGTLEWKNPLNFTGGDSYPNSSTTYEAVCTASSGCSSDKSSKTVTVSIIVDVVKYRKPVITVSENSIIKGQIVKVTATCEIGSRVSWTEPVGFGGGDHKPDATTIYKAKCVKPYPIPENALEDSDESSREVKVVCPIITTPILSSDKTEVTADEKATITASGCVGGVIQWRDGSIGDQKIVGIGEYSALCKINDCYGKESNIIKIKIRCEKPNSPVISATKLVTYNDEKVVITATSCSGTTLWNDSSYGSKIEVSNGTYFATCVENNCKSDFSNEITITNKKYFTYTVTVKIKKIFLSDFEETITFYSKETLKNGINFYDDIDCTRFLRFFKWFGDWLYSDYGTFTHGGINYSINVKTGYVFISTPR
ncbi:MAG: hypothetical protein MUF45_10505 [Spirosomaceae bacterium]|nr:hypothetical protein [Spirosomataceae bacterium]